MTKINPDSELIEQQDLMLAEFKKAQKITNIVFEPFGLLRFVVPKYDGATERVVKLQDTNSHKKRLIFSVLYTANFIAFVLKKEGQGVRATLSGIVPQFVKFLDESDFDEYNGVNILKKFEAYRVEHDGVKTQSTGLAELTRLFNLALDYAPFGNELLNYNDYKYLDLLSKTKAAASDEEEQTTLTDYFGFHSWLRRDDVGVGAELYRRAASPKLLMSSFLITIATALEHINKSKHAIIEVIKSANVKPDYFPVLSPVPKAEDYENGNKNEDFKKAVAAHKVETLNFKQVFFEKLWLLLLEQTKSESIDVFVDSLIYSQCSDVTIEYAKGLFWKQGIIPQQTSRITGKRLTIFKQSTSHSLLFTPEFTIELINYVNSNNQAVPISAGENYLFSLLMAYQTVPYSDIFRLRSSDFRLSRRQNGDVQTIDSDYFKSRAGRVHETESVSTSQDLGKAILCFLKDKTSDFTHHVKLVENTGLLQAKLGATTFISVFYSFLSKSTIGKIIGSRLLSQKCSPVFIDCIYAICTRGVRKERFERTGVNWSFNCETPCLTRIFSSEAVKNTRVHSESDSFDPTKITNYMSHSNETERKNYLNKQNQTWEDNCGRSTRLVMNDIELNVMRPSRAEITMFNKDFESAMMLIKTRAENTLTRLKIISSKANGKVDEFGFLSQDYVEGDLPDTI